MFVRILRKAWLIIGAIVLVLFCAVMFLDPRLTRYVESDEFRTALEKETAKGLHYPSGHYAPIRRTGFLTATSDGFQADHGQKALRVLDARGITARFNPWGFFFRRWQLDEVHIQSGEVEIQTYAPAPQPSPAKPWFHIFLPARVYLKRVESEPADVTWRFRGEKGGFFGTRLLITPHGRDFNYQATGGTLRGALIPELPLRDTRLLITKKLLTLYNLDLFSGPEFTGTIHAQGTAGTSEDRSVDFKFILKKVPLARWLPGQWREHLAGTASGKIEWRGRTPKLEDAEGEASLRIDGGQIRQSPLLDNIARTTNEKTLAHLTLDECSFVLAWKYPRIDFKNIAIEEKGKFRAEGAIKIEDKALTGTVELAVNRNLLGWLPKAEEIFTREHDGYLWTTVRLSGTIDAPKQDLSPRIIEVLKENPDAALELLLHQLGDWLKNIFGGG